MTLSVHWPLTSERFGDLLYEYITDIPPNSYCYLIGFSVCHKEPVAGILEFTLGFRHLWFAQNIPFRQVSSHNYADALSQESPPMSFFKSFTCSVSITSYCFLLTLYFVPRPPYMPKHLLRIHLHWYTQLFRYKDIPLHLRQPHIGFHKIMPL